MSRPIVIDHDFITNHSTELCIVAPEDWKYEMFASTTTTPLGSATASTLMVCIVWYDFLKRYPECLQD